MGIYLKLIWAYLKIGLFGFGGGYAMLSLISQEVVDTHWISNQTFTDIVAISQMTPGPIGINSATYIGYTVTGSVWGSLVATLTVVTPPFILVLFAGNFVSRHKENPWLQSAFKGLRPVVVGLIASAALLLMNADNFGHFGTPLLCSIIICICSLLLVLYTKLHPIFIIIMAGIAGYIFY